MPAKYPNFNRNPRANSYAGGDKDESFPRFDKPVSGKWQCRQHEEDLTLWLCQFVRGARTGYDSEAECRRNCGNNRSFDGDARVARPEPGPYQR
jgi:hypothetical protein